MMRKNPMEQNIRIPILFLKGHVFCLKYIAGNRHNKKEIAFFAINFLTIVLVLVSSYKEKHNKMENREIMYDWI